MNTNRYYDIMNGPSRDTLFDACKYAHTKDARIPINFSVAASYTATRSCHNRAYVPMEMFSVNIFGIEHEDGSGDSFNLHGNCYVTLDTPKTYTLCRFYSYYNTKTRKGCICFYD
ncbi:hypothetical protein IKE71_02790 [Candidatus Saccharibacteria bacterium]|nr:hypothetical protein [Candidatus Saccharibacteria bacterium]